MLYHKIQEVLHLHRPILLPYFDFLIVQEDKAYPEPIIFMEIEHIAAANIFRLIVIWFVFTPYSLTIITALSLSVQNN
ncbi:hypothetical protein ABEY41_13375 [Peribacillus butanolivorans]|uniref:hypothetical protein n=1 Tax=Peribacillus butanolivorans TaxID=421767 RepID=UPI003D2CB180